MSKMKRLGPKMLMSLLSTFLVVFGAFMIIVIIRTNSMSKNSANELLLNSANGYANAMGMELVKADNTTLGLQLALEKYEYIPNEERREYLDSILEEAVASENTVAVGAWSCFEPNALDGLDAQYVNTKYCDETGRYATYFVKDNNVLTGTVLVGYDIPGEGDYYLNVIKTGKPSVTDPYLYEVGGKYIWVTTFSYPIVNSNNEVVGAVGIDYSLDYIDSINDQVSLFDSGYGKMFTSEGMVVAHEDDEMIGELDNDMDNTSITQDIKDAAKKGETYLASIYSKTLDANAYKAFAPITISHSGTVWIYSIVVPESEVLEEANTLTMIIAAIGIIGTLITVVIIILISRSISVPVNAVCNVADIIANGDLTPTIDKRYLKKEDEIGILANNIEKMKLGLVETVSGIKNSTKTLESKVNDTNETLMVLNDRISDTSAATEQLSAGMQETGAASEEMNATAEEIEKAVESVAEKAEDGANKSSEIHSRAAEMQTNIKNAIDKSENIFSEIKVALEKALEDSKAVNEINALADAILGITSQTTLLALNASIEAARAGEAGRGFAVVANEISSLADNSKNTVTQIQQITKIVTDAVNALASSSSELLNFVANDVNNDYKDMLSAAAFYNQDATYVSDMTGDLSATSEELLASIQVLIRAISEVSTSAQEGASNTSSIAVQTSEIAENAKTIVENMDETQKTSDELVSLVEKFKL